MTSGGGHQFCTFFDSGYLPAGIALYDSLSEWLPAIDLRVLCLDGLTYDILETLDLPGLSPIRLDELESFDTALENVKGERSHAEYYFTCKPAFVRYLLDTTGADRLSYLDADLYFFRSPAELPVDWDKASLVIHAHNFPTRDEDLADRVGRFNAGFVSVKNDATGRACIERWREQCLDWCYDRVEGDRYADQKYLDEWPKRWGAAILNRPGIGTARWNLDRWTFSQAEGVPQINGEPLVFYHFEGLQRLTTSVWNPHASLPDIVERTVYRPYIQHRLQIQETAEQKTTFRIRDRTYRLGLVAIGHGVLENFARTLHRVADTCLTGLKGELLYVPPNNSEAWSE